MFVDASALVAILVKEPDFPRYAAALKDSQRSFVTEFVILETGLALVGGRGLRAEETHGMIERLLQHFRVETVALTPDITLTALKAFERYGKGRSHPAKLNMGDCLSYGAARVLDMPLLFKGDDFARTDVRSAL